MVHNMADSKASGFSKVVQKHSLRAKERFLQNFGKKDRTTDELFELYQSNFNKQQSSATRLIKELKNYAACAREMQTASKSLLECMQDLYEHDWPDYDTIPDRIKSIEMLWGDLCHKITEQCTIPLSTYHSQFSEIRTKMEKRGRKLLDYDAARHHYDSIQAASKKRDDMKLTKAREQMEESRTLYEVLNKELHEELPALYDSRVRFFIQLFQTLFKSEAYFHQEYAKVDQKLAEMIEKLAIEAAKGTFQSDAGRYVQQIQQHQQQQQQQQQDAPFSKSEMDSPQSTGILSTPTKIADHQSMAIINNNETNESGLGLPKIDELNNSNSSPSSQSNNDEIVSQTNGNYDDTTNHKNEKKSDELFEIPIGATTTDLPIGVLYKVKATFKYAAEDGDELSFESGEILHVVQYEDPEEQEEGWLMGIRELTGEKGLFPANFTRPI